MKSLLIDAYTVILSRTPLDWTQRNLFEGLRCFHSARSLKPPNIGNQCGQRTRAGNKFPAIFSSSRFVIIVIKAGHLPGFLALQRALSLSG